MDINVTYNKVQTGIFEVLLNGEKTQFSIHNGCLGESGYGRNVYGVWNDAKQTVKWIGSLQTAKKFVAGVLMLQARRNGGAQ